MAYEDGGAHAPGGLGDPDFILWDDHVSGAKGQSAGKIDPGVAVLDGLGLLLFLIPGVIAFAVDFNNGTIYLPGGSASLDDELGEQQLVAISIGTDGLTEESIELALREQLGSEVDISAPEVRVIRLDILDSAETTVPLK